MQEFAPSAWPLNESNVITLKRALLKKFPIQSDGQADEPSHPQCARIHAFGKLQTIRIPKEERELHSVVQSPSILLGFRRTEARTSAPQDAAHMYSVRRILSSYFPVNRS